MTPEELEAAFVELVEKKELDKIRQLVRHYAAGLPKELADEAFQDACLEVVRRNAAGGNMANVAGLLVTIGRRKVNRLRDEVELAKDVRNALGRRLDVSDAWDHDDVWQAKVERAVSWVKAKVDTWPASNRRRALMTIIDAAREGEQLEPKDLAKRLGCSPKTAGVWRRRAYDGLRRQAEAEGVCWDDIATSLGVDDDQIDQIDHIDAADDAAPDDDDLREEDE